MPNAQARLRGRCKPDHPTLTPPPRVSPQSGRRARGSVSPVGPHAEPETALARVDSPSTRRIHTRLAGFQAPRLDRPSVNEQGRVFWTRPLKLPVQDRFGGLADHSRGGPLGVRSTRVVNGGGWEPRFRGRQRGTNTPSLPNGVAEEVRRRPGGGVAAGLRRKASHCRLPWSLREIPTAREAMEAYHPYITLSCREPIPSRGIEGRAHLLPSWTFHAA